MVEDATDGSLAKVLSRWQLFAIGFGAIVGWGWIIQMGYWVNEAGPIGSLVAFAVGSILVLLMCLIYGELSSAMPYAGGELHYSKRAFGIKSSFACSWGLLLGYVGVVAFQAIALGVAIAYLIPHFQTFPLWTILGEPVYGSVVAVGILGVFIITYLNYRGVDPTAQFQLILVAIIILAAIILITGSFTVAPTVKNAPFGNAGLAGIAIVAIQVPGLFSGFAIIPQTAEEADMHPRSIGTVIVAVIFSVTLFYAITFWAVGQSVPVSKLADSLVPAATAMATVFNSAIAGKLMTLAGIAALLTSWSSFLIGASRLIYAMAESNMLPESLAHIHPKYNTPSRAIVLIGVITAIAPFLGEQMISSIINADSLGFVFSWIIVSGSFLYLRYTEPEMERPFKLPGGYLIGGLGLIASVLFLRLYLPGAPSALVWPKDWAIVSLWSLLGIGFFIYTRWTTIPDSNT